jgi:hypothetical protein
MDQGSAWRRIFSNRKSRLSHSDAAGNVYFSGKTRGTVDWDEQHQTSTVGFNNDAVLLKYNSDGELLMAQTAGGSSEDRYDSVAVGTNGEIFVSGMANGMPHLEVLTMKRLRLPTIRLLQK